jgi:hypothetical protein
VLAAAALVLSACAGMEDGSKQTAEVSYPGWARFLSDLRPAIKACLAQPVGPAPIILKAWPMNHGSAGMRIAASNGAKVDCVGSLSGDGQATLHSAGLEPLPGESDVILVPVGSTVPTGACWANENVAMGGQFIGVLAYKTCS